MQNSASRYELVPIDDIEIDLANPRIAMWIEMYGKDVPDEQIALALGVDSSSDAKGAPGYNDLKQSIITNGRIIHPIIVNREPSGRQVVIEGNTRVVIYRQLRDQTKSAQWERIPAMVYEGLDEGTIEAIRLQAHLVGPRPWNPYSKAKYLDYLRRVEHLTFDQIVDFCGGNKREVAYYIQAYEDMERFYRPLCESDAEFDPSRFSAFVELQNDRIQTALLNASFGKKDFAKWVKDRLISPLEKVRALPAILRNDKSREIFLKKGAKEAEKALEVPPPEASLKEATLTQLARETTRKINEISFQEVKRLRSPDEADERDIIFGARAAMVDLCEEIASNED